MTMAKRASESGVSLLEVLISILLLSLVVLANGSMIRALGVLGVVQYSPARYERPARLRTLAMEYVQAEMEFLRNQPYDMFRDDSVCNPGAPTPIISARRLPSPGAYLTGEPQIPSLFAAADMVVTTEPVVGASPGGCGPRRITVVVYLAPSDVPTTIAGSSGVVFVRGETARSPQ